MTESWWWNDRGREMNIPTMVPYRMGKRGEVMVDEGKNKGGQGKGHGDIGMIDDP
jgi:hypothetical protein